MASNPLLGKCMSWFLYRARPHSLFCPLDHTLILISINDCPFLFDIIRLAHHSYLGSQISLISKKNIRYEGILYSINEADATVALQDVKSFGTEGRELLDATGMSTFVPPNDAVHAYLLFRGQDIKDLHVHEKQPAKDAAVAAADPPSVTPPPPATSDPARAPQAKATAPAKATTSTKATAPAKAPASNKAPVPAKAPAASAKSQQQGGKNGTAAPPQQKKQPPPQQQHQPQQKQQQQTQQQKKQQQQQPKQDAKTKATSSVVTSKKENEVPKASQSSADASSSTNNRHPNNNMVGMGASLLNRKTRGPKGEG